MEVYKPIEILDVQKKHPFRYKFWTWFPWAVAIGIIIWIVLGYLGFVLYDLSGAIFSVWVLILIYFVRWLIRGFDYIISTLRALLQLKKYESINFNNILSKKLTTNEERIFAKKLPTDKTAKDVIHWCMIPMYNESPEILYETIKNISEADYDLSKLAITIHWEARQEECFQKAREACQPFADKFWYFWHTLHTLQPDEMPWKWANITYWIKLLYPEILEHFNTTTDNILVTTLDADNMPANDYFSILTYTYLATPNRKYASYQPVAAFFNNFRQAPFFSKIVWLFNTFWVLFNFVKKYWPKNFSSHAQPLDALIDLDFWSVQTIVEDGHQYWRSFYGFRGNYQCVPVYAKIFQDCNLDVTIPKTMKAQYNQMRRRSHGAQDLRYVRAQMIDQRKTIDKSRVLFELWRAIEWFVLWSTLHIVLLAGLVFSFFKDVPLSNYISLWSAISVFTKIALILTVVCLLLSLFIFPFSKLKEYKKGEIAQFLFRFILWFFFLVGPSLVIFASLPALHTQIGLVFWRPMKKFNVTTKVR